MAKNGDAAGLLRSLRDRIVRLEEEKRAIAEDIKGVYAEAKSQGFDVKALRVVVKRAMEDETSKAKRRETEELAEVYLASLGMLEGTPLGDAARERMLPETAKSEPEPSDDDGDGGTASDGGAPEPAKGSFSPEEIAAARNRGADDCKDGKRIIDNPFTAGDPRRAAWDEGHCHASGSDGMEIPESWRRKPKAPEKGADA